MEENYNLNIHIPQNTIKPNNNNSNNNNNQLY